MSVLKAKLILQATSAYIFFCILFYSCNTKSSYTKESEFRRYLLEIYHINVDTVQNTYFFVLQMNMCGSCTEKSIKFIQEFTTSQPVYFLLSAPNTDNESALHKDSKHIILKVDGYTFERYGLRSSKDILLHIKQGKIRSWDYLPPSI